MKMRVSKRINFEIISIITQFRPPSKILIMYRMFHIQSNPVETTLVYSAPRL